MSSSTISGQSSDGKTAGYYEFEWHVKWMATKKNANGTTGWGTILQSNTAAYRPRTVCRIHLCAFKPCRAVHHVSKYGGSGPPMHLLEVQKPAEFTAVAETTDSQSSSHVSVQPSGLDLAVSTPRGAKRRLDLDDPAVADDAEPTGRMTQNPQSLMIQNPQSRLSTL